MHWSKGGIYPYRPDWNTSIIYNIMNKQTIYENWLRLTAWYRYFSKLMPTRLSNLNETILQVLCILNQSMISAWMIIFKLFSLPASLLVKIIYRWYFQENRFLKFFAIDLSNIDVGFFLNLLFKIGWKVNMLIFSFE